MHLTPFDCEQLLGHMALDQLYFYHYASRIIQLHLEYMTIGCTPKPTSELMPYLGIIAGYGFQYNSCIAYGDSVLFDGGSNFVDKVNSCFGSLPHMP